MATVTLRLLDGGERIRMPRLCIVCGERDCSRKNVTFSSRFIKQTFGPFGQAWRRTLYTTVPLCEEHWGHFDGQLLRAFGCMGTVLLFALAAGLAGSTFVTYRAIGTVALWGLAVAAGLAALAILALVLLTRGADKYATCESITEKSITLLNVHRKFAKAVEDGDWGGGEDDRRRGKDRRPDEELRTPNKAAAWAILGVGVLAMLLACGGVVAGFQLLIPRPGPGPGPGPAKPPDTKAAPLPIDPTWNDTTMKRVFLTDLPEFDGHFGWGKLGKGGVHGFGYPGVGAELNRVLFKGAPSPRALAMVPPSNGAARIKYRIEGQRLLRGKAAMADLPPAVDRTQAVSPFNFSVLGDGRLLWESGAMQKPGDAEEFRLSVQGVKELELRVTTRGSLDSAWAAWLDPYLLR